MAPGSTTAAAPEPLATALPDVTAIAVVHRQERWAVPSEPARVIAAGVGAPFAPGATVGTSVERWRALSGFEVALRAAGPPDAADLARQLHVLGYLMALPEDLDWALQVRQVARPAADVSPVAARLGLTLLCAASGATREGAERRLRQVAGAVAIAGGFLGPRYELIPVADVARLEDELAPFPFVEMVEIERQRQATPGAATLLVPVPLPARESAGVWLCHALVTEAARQERPLAWIATLESADDVGALRLHLAEELSRLRDALRRPVDGHPAGGERALVLDASHYAELETAGQTIALQWRALAGLSARVQAFLVGPGEVPASVVAAAIAECSGAGSAAGDGTSAPAVSRRVSRPRELSLARQALDDLRCLARDRAGDRPLRPAAVEGDPLQEPDSPRTPAHVADVVQAAALFGLPIPDSRGLPGLPIARAPREIWLVGRGTGHEGQGAARLLLGENVAGGRRQPVALALDDRRRHVYVVGQTGTGKSTLLLNLIVQDLEAGLGLAVVDPHGDLIRQVLERVPADRIDDVVLIDPSDHEHPVGFNFLECEVDQRDQVVESFIGLLYQLYDPYRQGIVGPRFEHGVRNAMHTVMAHEGLTLVEVVRVMTDSQFVQRLLPRVTDPLVRRYWTDQIAQTSDFHKSEVLDYVVSKFSNFVTNRLVRNIIGQSRSTFSLRAIMDEGNILLVNLAQGKLGQKLSAFLGSVIVPKVLLAALSRVDLPREERRDFALYVDEFQSYATPAFVDIVSGARKYGLSITMAHQHVAQLPAEVREAILGNVGTQLALRVGVHDAALLAGAMQPSAFGIEDFVELPNFRAIARVLADGRYRPCFTLATHDEPPSRGGKWAAEIGRRSQARYGRPRDEVEREIARRGDR